MAATLLSLTFVIPVVWLAYTARAWWAARGEWERFSSDTKAFYLLVAPPITLSLDLFLFTDRLFYWPKASSAVAGLRRRLPAKKTLAVFAAFALCSDAALAAELEPPADASAPVAMEEPIGLATGQDAKQPYLSPLEASLMQYREPEPADAETAAQSQN